MRLFSLVAIGLIAAGASAQTTFRLVDPLLSVDGRRMASIGAPLVQRPFGVLQIQVPGVGTYTVSERPFAGARRAGEFDGNGLVFTSRGRTLRLYSREQILSLDGAVSAYVSVESPTSRRRRGLARLSVADAVDGRGSRNSAPAPIAARAETGPRPSLSDRPAAAHLERLTTPETPPEDTRPQLDDRPAAAYLAEDHLADDVDALAAERDRLRIESAQLSDALQHAESERDRIDRDYAILRQRLEAAEAEATRAGALRSDLARAEATARDLRAERDRVAAERDARDRAIALLEAEAADREGRIPAVLAELAHTRRQLDEALAARDAALASRNDAYALRDDALRARDDAQAEARALRDQVDRLRRQGAMSGDADLQDQRDALALDRLRLEADRAAFEADRDAFQAERAAFEAERRAGRPTSDLAERQTLLDQIGAAQAERQTLLAEQAALLAERDRLAGELRRLRDQSKTEPPVSRTSARDGVTVRTPIPPQDGAVVTLPDFDFGRLQNPDVVQRRLSEAEYPHWATVGRVEGDVLVLFQADATGRVTRTAVPSPLGGGLDALAEDLVREMRFVPPVVNGQPAGLRSQVLVRFRP